MKNPSARWHSVDEERVNTAYKDLRRKSYPIPKYRSRKMKKEILSFKKYAEINAPNMFEGDRLKRTFHGSQIIAPYHPHRYKEGTSESLSLHAAFKNEKLLKRAIRLTIADGREPTLHNVKRAVKSYHLGRSPTHFFPAQSAGIIHRYSKPGDTVLDPFVGYGGSIPAAAVLNRKFIGIDVNPKSIEGDRKMARDLQRVLKLKKGDIRIIQGDTRKVMHSRLPSESVDLVYTSPPYFDRERYTGKRQSHRIGSYSKWLNTFYVPAVAGMNRVTRKDGFVVINIAPVRVSGKLKYPIDDHTLALSGDLGLTHVETKRLPLGARGRGIKGPTKDRKSEPIFVFRKTSNPDIARAQRKADLLLSNK